MASSSACVLRGSIYVMKAGDFKEPALQQNGSSCLWLEQLLSIKTNIKTAVERHASVLVTHSTQVLFRCAYVTVVTFSYCTYKWIECCTVQIPSNRWVNLLAPDFHFLVVQVIYICVYITNYLHFSTIFLSF